MKLQLFSLILIAGLVTAPVAQAQRGPGGGQRQGSPPIIATLDNASRAVSIQTITIVSPWWNNNATVTRLGLTDLQKSKIEGVFEAHRQSLVSTKAQLEKEELQLSKLLEAETIDRNGIFTQINRVIQARGEMERANSTMSLEMREQLTRAQWVELQLTQPRIQLQSLVDELTVQPAGGRGGRGGRGTPPPQQ